MAGQQPGGSVDTPATKFATSRGARIAYQDFGQTSPVVVAIPPTAQNIEVAWEWPAVRAMFERFGSFSRWIQFDKRGSGASDRRTRAPGIDERVEDLRAVMDAAEVDRAFLYGASEGGPTCLLFAVTYPERVEGLIIHGSGPFTERQDLDADERRERLGRYEDIADMWGTEASPWVDHFAPSLAHDDDYQRWHRRYERLAADRDSLVQMLEISLDVDVTEVLPTVSVPTLVLHRAGDPIIPVEWGRLVADGVPGARLIEFEGADHFGYAGDQGWLDELESFVTGSPVEGSDGPAAARPVPPRPPVAIRTLGTFGVDVDGVAVPNSAWGSRKARMLLKRLVAARGWPVRREELCALLWPENAEYERLGPRLSVQLSHVRRVLGGGVVADRSTVALDLAEVGTDLEALLSASDDEAIVEIYRGDFLPNDVYDDWTAPIRDEARLVFLGAARRLAERAISEADLVLAIELVERSLLAEPYDEAAFRLGIRAWSEAGDYAAAHRLHQRATQAMSELGVDFPPIDALD